MKTSIEYALKHPQAAKDHFEGLLDLILEKNFQEKNKQFVKQFDLT